MEGRDPLPRLLGLPSQVVGSLWPPEQVLCGLCVCTRLHNELLSCSANVKLTVKDSHKDSGDHERINVLLHKINGKVQMQWPPGAGMGLCRDAMRGRVDDLVVSSWRPEVVLSEADAQTVAVCMPELRSLSLDVRKFELRAITPLRALLTNFPVGASNLQALSILGLSYLLSEEHIFPALARVVTLRSLHVEFGPSSIAGHGLGNMLAGLSRLERLHIMRAHLQGGMVAFMQGLQPAGAPPALPALTALTLQYVDIESNDTPYFCEFLAQLSKLTRLRVNDLGIHPSNIYTIGQQIGRLPALTELDINELGTFQSARWLLPWLGRCTELRVLKIQALTAHCVAMVVRNLHACTHLRALDISENSVLDTEFFQAAEAEVLAEELARLPALRSLQMRVRFMAQAAVDVFRTSLPRVALVVWGTDGAESRGRGD